MAVLSEDRKRMLTRSLTPFQRAAEMPALDDDVDATVAAERRRRCDAALFANIIF